MSCTWRPGPDDELARIAAAFAADPDADGPGAPEGRDAATAPGPPDGDDPAAAPGPERPS